jgi:hypothetical protein
MHFQNWNWNKYIVYDFEQILSTYLQSISQIQPLRTSLSATILIHVPVFSCLDFRLKLVILLSFLLPQKSGPDSATKVVFVKHGPSLCSSVLLLSPTPLFPVQVSHYWIIDHSKCKDIKSQQFYCVHKFLGQETVTVTMKTVHVYSLWTSS